MNKCTDNTTLRPKKSLRTQNSLAEVNMVKKLCNICQKPFFVTPARNKIAKFCSHYCYSVSLRKKIGSLNSFYGKNH